VYDCLVVGVPDDRWGRAVTAVVAPVPGETPGLADLAAHVRSTLAGYKAPKHLVVVDAIVRSPSGKADYRWAQRTAAEAVAAAGAPQPS
jgi:acyl-CoA synthetase (AMP-forming)/AMP-acid ligase II